MADGVLIRQGYSITGESSNRYAQTTNSVSREARMAESRGQDGCDVRKEIRLAGHTRDLGLIG